MWQGAGMPKAGKRVERLREALEILRGMLINEEFSYKGKYWTRERAINILQPIQRPMRINVGCSKPRLLRLSPKYADGPGNNPCVLPDVIEVKKTKFYQREVEGDVFR